MQYSNVSDFSIIEEGDAEGEVSRIYEEYKRKMQTPIVPNILKGLATSPAALAMYWDIAQSLLDNLTLPESLMHMENDPRS